MGYSMATMYAHTTKLVKFVIVVLLKSTILDAFSLIQ